MRRGQKKKLKTAKEKSPRPKDPQVRHQKSPLRKRTPPLNPSGSKNPLQE